MENKSNMFVEDTNNYVKEEESMSLHKNEFIDAIKNFDLLPEEMLDQSGAILYSEYSTLKNGNIYLLGINPDGDEKTIKTSIIDYCMNNDVNEYLDENWMSDTRKPVLQKRMECLFEKIGYNLRNVCASNLIFTRSISENAIVSWKKLAEFCWPVHNFILAIVNPKAIIVHGKKPFIFITEKFEIIENIDFIESGHGNWKCCAIDGILLGRKTILIYIPHLSRYDINKYDNVMNWIRLKCIF